MYYYIEYVHCQLFSNCYVQALKHFWMYMPGPWVVSIASVRPKPTMDADVDIFWFLFLIDDTHDYIFMKS